VEDTPGELLDPNDFSSIHLKVSFTNTATHTEVKPDIDLSGKGMKLIEFRDQGLVLEGPGGICAEGHNVMIHIHTDGAKPEIQFGSTAKVEQVEKLPDKRLQLTVRLIQFDEGTWKALQGVYSNRQDEIMDFFNAVKGH